MWSIKFLSGPQAGKEIFLQKGLVILGRDSSCKIKIQAQGISKKHAQIIMDDTSLRIEDLNSSNGTFVNGKQIQTRHLKSGDRISIYNVLLEVKQQHIVSYPHPYFTHSPQIPKQEFASNNESMQANANRPPSSFFSCKSGFKNYIY